MSGGIKKSAKDEAEQGSSKDKDNADDDVDPLLQTQFGKPRQTKVRRGYRSAGGSNSQG